jgi:hypothetical protein
MASQIGVPIPKTVLLPSKDHPPTTTSESMRNLMFPLNWEEIFEYVGFPAFLKPHDGGGWKHVYKVHNPQEFFEAYHKTADICMTLQAGVEFDEYYRCYAIGKKYIHIMPYEPRNPHHLRYVADHKVSKALQDQMHDLVLRINHYLGYDFNTVEFAIRDGIPYAIDFCNPAPDADVNSVGEENFEWVVENAAKMTIEKALAHKEGGNNLTWGQYLQDSVAGRMSSIPTEAKPAKASSKAKK